MIIPDATLRAIAENLVLLGLDPVLHAKVTIAVFTPLIEHQPTPALKLPPVKVKALPPRRVARAKSKRDPHPSERGISQVDTAVTFLRNQLADGPKQSSEVEDAAMRRHISPNALGRAKTILKVSAARLNAGHGNVVHLQLPPD